MLHISLSFVYHVHLYTQKCDIYLYIAIYDIQYDIHMMFMKIRMYDVTDIHDK